MPRHSDGHAQTVDNSFDPDAPRRRKRVTGHPHTAAAGVPVAAEHAIGGHAGGGGTALAIDTKRSIHIRRVASLDDVTRRLISDNREWNGQTAGVASVWRGRQWLAR